MKFRFPLRHVMPITFTVFLKPERGATRAVAHKLSGMQAWAKIEELEKSGAGKAWALPY